MNTEPQTQKEVTTPNQAEPTVTPNQTELIETFKELLSEWWAYVPHCDTPDCGACRKAEVNKVRYEAVLARAQQQPSPRKEVTHESNKHGQI